LKLSVKRFLSILVFILLVVSAVFISTQPGRSNATVDNLSETIKKPEQQNEFTPTPKIIDPTPAIEGTVGPSNTVYEALLSQGLPSQDVFSLTGAFENVFDFRSARPKDAYSIYLTNENTIQKFVYKRDLLNEFIAEKKENGGFDVIKKEIIPDEITDAKEFTLTSSLYNAILAGGEHQELVDKYVSIFAWDIDFYLYPRKGDKIVILYRKYYKDGIFIKYGDVLAAQYISKERTFSSFMFNDGEQKAYYDEDGHPIRKMFLKTPLKFGKKTSGYSIRRFHPVLKKYRRHTGIDYGAKTGTAIFATAGGRVVFSGREGGYGKLVIVQHPNRYRTYYGHCSKLLVKKGAVVEQGQIIAKVGATGLVTGPHVHYEVRVNKKPINPNTLKNTKGKPIKPEMLARYRQIVEERSLLTESIFKEREAFKISLFVKGGR